MSRSEQICEALRTKGKVDVEEYAPILYGILSNHTKEKTKSIVYCVAHRVEKELGKKMVYKQGVFTMEDKIEETPVTSIHSTNDKKIKENKIRSKTAVFVVKEKQQNGETNIEIDVVGEFSRRMIKEILKQLMEVYV
jgi:hypothetical protein